MRFNLKLLYFFSIFQFFCVFLLNTPVHAYRVKRLNQTVKEFVERLDRGLNRDVDRVVVYLFTPEKKVHRGLSHEEIELSKEIDLAVERAIVEIKGKNHIKSVITKDKKWERIIHKEYDREALNPKTISDIGYGIGAKYVITGEYYFDKNGNFHLQGKLFELSTGKILSTAEVSNSIFCLYPESIKKGFILISILAFLFVALLAGYNYMKNKKIISYRSEIEDAINRREVEKVRELKDSSLFNCINKSTRKKAEALTISSKGIEINGDGRIIRFAPGPVQSLGRGKNCVLEGYDPHFSRSPQAWIKCKDSKIYLEHNSEAKNQTFVNEKPIDVVELKDKDTISAGSSVKFRVSKSSDNSYLKIKGEKDKNSLFFVMQKAPVINGCFVIFEKGVPYLECIGSAVDLSSELWQKKWNLTSGEKFPLVTGDVIDNIWEVKRI